MKLTLAEKMRKQFETAVPGHGRFAAKSNVVKAETDTDERLIKALVSTTEIDQEGDVVLPDGADMSYFPNAVKTVYLNHDYDRPIGVCRKMAVRPNGLYALTYIARTALGDEVLTLVREGVIGGMSVGFRTIEAGKPTEAEVEKYGQADRVVRSYKLVEYSLTAMPMNQGALIQKARNMVSKDTLEALQIDYSPKSVVVDMARRPIVVPKAIVIF